MTARRTAVATLSALALVTAACGGAGTADTTSPASAASDTTTSAPGATGGTAAPLLSPVGHRDPAGDCRAAFIEGPAECGPGADITAVEIDPSGPIVVAIQLTERPHYDDDFQWLVEFAVSDLACGITNTSSDGGTFVGSDILGPYGYRILTNENAPPGICEGSLNGTTATITFNIQPPLGPWTVSGGTQYAEIQNLEDDGSADDVVVEMTGSG